MTQRDIKPGATFAGSTPQDAKARYHSAVYGVDMADQAWDDGWSEDWAGAVRSINIILYASVAVFVVGFLLGIVVSFHFFP